MTEQLDADVLVVGAGPTGLTLAIDLARRGVSVRVVEKAVTGRTGDPGSAHLAGSRGKGLQPRTLEVFDDLGVIDEILRTGAVYPPLRINAGRVPVWTAHMHKKRAPSAAVPYPMTLMQPQWRTEQILLDRFTSLGGTVQTGVELAGFTQDAAAVTATFTDGRTVRARYLVGADGGRSVVRKALGIGFQGETREDERMLLGDVKAEGLPRDRWQVWINPVKLRVRVTMCPLPGTDTFQLTAPLEPGEDPDFSLATFQGYLDRSGRRDIRLTEVTWASVYRVNIRMVERYRDGRVLLAGDSAHVHSPAGGQGLNTGVQDAYNLGWKLARVLAGGPGALLDTYEGERLPVAAAMLGLSTRLHDLAAKGGGRKAYKRDEETSQLLLSYAGGPLARGDRGGERAPDAPCRRPDGTATRLFDVYRGPHSTLLSLEGAPGTDLGMPDVRRLRVGTDLVDDGGHIRDAYGTGGHVLVRPDGYIGLVTTSETELAEYLTQI
ncbi:FAD-dependent oxidoreductase [Longispora sp. NPDC051575]|uniref:FAD-dependent oxidoreductase n=1 Tax=Longispora sp. NPDC051575 TaxID=3154943 RepID=UPI003426D7C4